MKIAYIYDLIYPYTKGGAEKRFWELAKRLSAKGHLVHLFGMKFWDGDASFIKDGIQIHGVCKPSKFYLKTGLRNAAQVINFTFLLAPALWKEKFDIIDCNAFPYLPFFSVKLYSVFKKVPLAVTWQEVWGPYWHTSFGYFLGFIGRLIEIMVIKLSDYIIPHAIRVKNNLIRYGAKEINIRLITDGVDTEAIATTPLSLVLSDVIFVGRFIKEKRVDLIIRSIFLVKKELPDIKCLIIGEGNQKHNLLRLVKELGLEGNIIFKGFVEDQEGIFSYLKASKIFVFPSVREGFGIAAIEAMACGLPVITVNHPMNAAAEIVKDGQTGFICQLDEKDIAAKILNLIKYADLRNSMSKQAEEFALGYDWDRIACENEEFYEYVLNKG